MSDQKLGEKFSIAATLEAVAGEHGDDVGHLLVAPERRVDAVAVDRAGASGEIRGGVGVAPVVGQVDHDVLDAELAREACALVAQEAAMERQSDPHASLPWKLRVFARSFISELCLFHG